MKELRKKALYELFADIGGLLGLFLGISLLNFAELLTKIIIIIKKKRTQNRNQNIIRIIRQAFQLQANQFQANQLRANQLQANRPVSNDTII